MTVAAIPAPVTTRSQRRKWSERLFVAVLFIGLAARGGFSYPRGQRRTESKKLLVTSSVLVTTSKALVTRSDALVTSSFLLLVKDPRRFGKEKGLPRPPTMRMSECRECPVCPDGVWL